MLQTTYNFNAETAMKFKCDKCDFKCSKLSNWNKHLSTSKHSKADICLQTTDNFDAENAEINSKCKCGKQYKHRQSLYKHKQKCSVEKQDEPALTDIVSQEFVMNLLKQNNELQQQLIDLCKTSSANNISNNSVNINSNNKAFNLNVFLNEECKDAMSITDFVNSIKLQLSDLEAVGKLGFVNGISDIIIKNLKALDVHKRPVHCTDTKRETMYVKGAEAWVKEGDDNKQLRLAIKRVARNNFICLELFKAKHPDCINWDSKHGDHYQKLRIEALGGRGNEDCDNEDKIIRRIARETTIDKSL